MVGSLDVSKDLTAPHTASAKAITFPMSAFGGKADLFHYPAKGPLIAKSRHSTYQVGDKVWGIAVGLLEFEGRVEQGGAGFRHIRMNKP